LVEVQETWDLQAMTETETTIDLGGDRRMADQKATEFRRLLAAEPVGSGHWQDKLGASDGGKWDA
jgi:hypothetical protein